MRRIVLPLMLGLAACSGHVVDSSAVDSSASDAMVSRNGAAAGRVDAGVGTRAEAGRTGSAGSAGTRAARPDAAMLHADAGKAPGTGGGGVGGNAAADAGRPDAGAISSGPAEVRFVGRVDRSDPAGARFAWSGTGVTARFMASSLAVKLGGGQEYTALLDGELLPKLVPGNGDTKLADNLEAGPHLIELYRRTEANQGESQFQGFVFDAAGTLLPPTLAPTRRLEVIGDSITCGFGNEGADETCGFTPQTENHYLTYGAIAARAVGAELSTIAWSGLGVVCNYGDGAQSCVDPLPTYYDRTLPQRTDSRWDFANFQPQAVIINLGTNDFSTDQDPSATDFTNAYRDFLMHVRSKYPDAWILCTCGPLLYGSELDLVRGYIADAVMATGDAKIGTFEIPSQSSADGLGCSYHPSIKTHQKMADLLIAELAARLGW